MKNKFFMVMDFYFSEISGGAELNAESLVDRFIESGYKIKKKKSAEITINFLKKNKDCYFIFSNFILLKEECKQYAIKNLKYFIYEQDHKYLKTRNPITFPNFIAPPNQLANIDFYKNSIKVLFLTKLAKDVFVSNTKLSNVINLNSSVWRKEELQFLKTICNTKKIKDIAVMDSSNPIKRKHDCISYCKKNNLNFELIKDSNFKNFMKKMSSFKKLVFFTGHLETCARIVVEAKMLNLKVIFQKRLVGAASEDWFSLSGETLIDEMEKISSEMPKRIVGLLSD